MSSEPQGNRRVSRLVAIVRHWLGANGSGRRPSVPYEVACACGTLVRGVRQTRYQTPRCEHCGEAVFILPLSPLPPPARTGEETRLPPATQPPARRPLLWALAVLPVVLLPAAVLLLWPRAGGTRLASRAAPDSLDEVRARIAAGSKALGEGNSQLAVEELDAARRLAPKYRQQLPHSEARHLAQLHRQATLLADLLTESLGELLDRAAGLEEREWQAVFQRRYRDRAVIFDAEVRRDAAGQYQLGYRVWAGLEAGRVAVEDLNLLALLPLERPQRMVFGARLAAVRREPPGEWVVHFEPGSGVLLTHPGAVAACLFKDPDANLQQVLRLQEAWLADLP
jgi:hypothetical protein